MVYVVCCMLYVRVKRFYLKMLVSTSWLVRLHHSFFCTFAHKSFCWLSSHVSFSACIYFSVCFFFLHFSQINLFMKVIFVETTKKFFNRFIQLMQKFPSCFHKIISNKFIRIPFTSFHAFLWLNTIFQLNYVYLYKRTTTDLFQRIP